MGAGRLASRRAQGVERKSWNINVAVLGEPGTGKSYYAFRLAQALAVAAPCYVVAHDSADSFDEWAGPGGVYHHDSDAEVYAGLRSRPSAVHCLEVEDGGEVLRVARGAAELAATAAAGGRAVPVIALLDEIGDVDGASPRRIAPDVLRVVRKRRHIGSGIGIIWTGQSAYFAHRSLFNLSTQFVLFRLSADEDIARLKSKVPREALELVPTLPDRHHIVIERGGTSIASILPIIDGGGCRR